MVTGSRYFVYLYLLNNFVCKAESYHSVETCLNCSVFHKLTYNSFRDLLIFTISNLYIWTGIFSLITVIHLVLVVYKKLANKLENEYLKSKNITNSGRYFSLVFVVIAYGIIKLTKVFIILNL